MKAPNSELWRRVPNQRMSDHNYDSSVKTFPRVSKISWSMETLNVDVIKWKHFLRYWSFVRWPVDSTHMGQWHGALIFSLICTSTNGDSCNECCHKICKTLMCVNSLWPSDAIWWHKSGFTLAQVMACCLTAPSYYRNHCWLIINGVLWHSPQIIFAKGANGLNP